MFAVYFGAATFTFAPYYNWQYATTHGFGSWLLFGEVVATAQAAAWPYFVFFKSSGSSASPAHVAAAIRYHNQAAVIGNKAKGTVTREDIAAIVDLYAKALAEAKQADIASMNRDLPGFGDRFKEDFARGLEMFVESYNKRDGASLIAAQVLIDRWGQWFEANYQQITRK